jgi:hypothetical protein
MVFEHEREYESQRAAIEEEPLTGMLVRADEVEGGRIWCYIEGGIFRM